MIRITFQLDRPAITHLNEYATGSAATAADGSKPTRYSGSKFDRLLEVGNDLLLGRATTA